MARLNNKARDEHTYDAIVVGPGITGGYAAMELTMKGLRTLVLERGPMVRHIADYPTANTPPWGAEYPRGQLPPQMMDAVYPMQ
ncbi:MAG: GMC family oxidoreductase, partial [Phenylobacterium sp.]